MPVRPLGEAMALLDTVRRATKAFAERRSSFRHVTNCQAWIECSDRAQSRSCIIVDMSNGGARIELTPPYELPEELSLILAVGGGKITRHVRIVWRANGEVGVRYVR